MSRRQRDVLLPLAEEKVRLTTAAWRGGKGVLSEVIGARRERIDTELKAIAVEGERQQMAARLHYAYGDLWRATMKHINKQMLIAIAVGSALLAIGATGGWWWSQRSMMSMDMSGEAAQTDAQGKVLYWVRPDVSAAAVRQAGQVAHGYAARAKVCRR